MKAVLDVCVRGGGVVGRTLALLLARAPLRIGLVDTALASARPASGTGAGAGARAKPASGATRAQRKEPAAGASADPDVRAYALNHRSRGWLESVRAWPDDSAVCAITDMEVHGDEPDAVVGFRASDHGAEALAWVVDVPALEQRLADAIAFQPAIEVLAEPAPAALTVICEGRTSQTRDELGVTYQRHAYGQRAIAARLRCERGHGGVARQWFGPQGAVLGVLPLTATSDRSDGNFVAIVWSVPDALATELEALDDASFVQRLQTNPAAAGFSAAYGGVSMISPRAAWPLAVARADRWVGTFDDTHAWALAGDAAHTIHPLAGQGLNIGLADAATLAQGVAARRDGRDYWRPLHDLKPLRAYERERKAALLAVGTVNDGLQRLFARDDDWSRRLRNWGMGEFDRAGFLRSWLGREAMGV